MSRNKHGDEIEIHASSDGPTRGGFPTEPKRPEAPSFASESALLKAMKDAPLTEASLRISQFAYRINGVMAAADDEAIASWKADYRRIMDKWRKQQGRSAA